MLMMGDEGLGLLGKRGLFDGNTGGGGNRTYIAATCLGQAMKIGCYNISGRHVLACLIPNVRN